MIWLVGAILFVLLFGADVFWVVLERAFAIVVVGGLVIGAIVWMAYTLPDAVTATVIVGGGVLGVAWCGARGANGLRARFIVMGKILFVLGGILASVVCGVYVFGAVPTDLGALLSMIVGFGGPIGVVYLVAKMEEKKDRKARHRQSASEGTVPAARVRARDDDT